VIIGVAVAWERNQQHTIDLERRIEILEGIEGNAVLSP